MSRHATHARAGSDRTSLYQEITDKIIAELDAGRVPWVQPWGTASAQAALAMPQNASTQRCYSGINVLILWGAVIEHGFTGQSWLTFRQALGLGGNVRKGERGTTVVYADRFTPDDERRRAAETGETPGAIPFLKRFTVFNTDQCEGLPEAVAAMTPPPPPATDPRQPVQVRCRRKHLVAALEPPFQAQRARLRDVALRQTFPPPRNQRAGAHCPNGRAPSSFRPSLGSRAAGGHARAERAGRTTCCVRSLCRPHRRSLAPLRHSGRVGSRRHARRKRRSRAGDLVGWSRPLAAARA